MTGKQLTGGLFLGWSVAIASGLLVWGPREESLRKERETTCEVYFSPRGGCQEAVIREIKLARREILVQAYYLTSDEIVEALIAEQGWGTKIKVILDEGAAKTASGRAVAAKLSAAGCEVWVDGNHAIAHNKIIVIDSKVVITGSYNFTENAEMKNAENLVVIRSRELAKRYRTNWLEHAGHAKTWEIK